MKNLRSVLFTGALLLCIALFALCTFARAAQESYTGDYTVLSVGSRGNEVMRLQLKLKELGYLQDTADGIYGQNTKTAVENFQYMHALKKDGIAGIATLRRLYESDDLTPMPKSGRLPQVTQPPKAAPVPAGVEIIYEDQFGSTLYTEKTQITETTLFTASYAHVPDGCKLKSERQQEVLYYAGKAYPARIVFRFLSPIVPQTLEIPVYYVVYSEAGQREVLFSYTLTLTPGSTTRVEADLSLVPGYTLISTRDMVVFIDSMANAAPRKVDFVLRKTQETAAPAQEE